MKRAIDPEWAWSEFSPERSDRWNLNTAAHLFRRAGFGATRQELESALTKSPGEIVQEMLNPVQPDAFLRDMKLLSSAAIASGNTKQLSAWWVWRMLTTPAQLLEKTTLFWHSHFATGADKVTDPALMLTQNELLRAFAFGDFAAFVLEISRDPAMLIYLDSATNRKAHPNENYAREVMELFCLGEGQYSEYDIRELARCFTGWEIRRGEFRFNRFQHDSGVKRILGQEGPFGGEEGVRIVVEQNSAPEFIVTKLIRCFVMDEPAADEALVKPLAGLMRDSGMMIQPVLQRILSSNLFFSGHAVGRKVRSPVELAIGMLRCLEGSTNSFELAEALHDIGQGLLYPPGVKGWDGGRTWINSSTLLSRSNLVRSLITSEKTRFGRKSLPQYLVSLGLTNPADIIEHLETLMFAVPVPQAAKQRIAQLMTRSNSNAMAEGLHALCTLPEFQLS